MTGDEAQARWLLNKGWLDQTRLAKVLTEGELRPGIDLAGRLVILGYLDQARARELRQATGSIAPVAAPAEPFVPPPIFADSADPSRSLSLSYEDLRRSIDSGEAVPMTGRTFRKYEVKSELGRGAVGMILRARDTKLDRAVALKLMLDDDPSGEEAHRFKREAHTLSELDHPHIVKVFEFGEEDRVAYMTMELIEGLDLKRRVREHIRLHGAPPPWRTTARILRSIAEALVFCHSRGVLHRDIKPSNIMIEKGSNRPVLLDFGLVKRAPKEGDKGMSVSLSKTGEIVGTPAFMAPEQLDAKGTHGAITEKTDVWGLGATLFYALTGTTPYADATSVLTYVALLTRDPRRVREVNPDVPSWLDELCALCLQRDAAERIALEEIASELEARAARGGRAANPMAAGRRRRTVREPGEPRAWRPLVARIAAGLGLAAVLALAIIFGLRALELRIEALEVSALRTREPSVTIKGELSRSGYQVLIGEKAARADGDGRFVLEVPLEPGVNRFAAAVLDGRGAKVAERELPEVIRDLEPPQLRLNNRQILGYYQVYEGAGGLRLVGLLKDDSRPCRLLIGDKAAELRADNSFSLLLEDKDAPQRLALRFEDALGNGDEKVLEVMTPKAMGFMDALRDIKAWGLAETSLQDAIIAEIDQRLGPAFRHKQTDIYQCNGQRHRIATFIHEKTQMELLLIPGGPVKVGLTAAELAREEAVYKKQLEDLPEGFKGQLYPGQVGFESPARTVTIAAPYLIGRFELRRDEFYRVAEGEPRDPVDGDRPIDDFSWVRVQDWLAAAGDGLRLPSEAEWEHAARSGATTRYFYGDDFDVSYGRLDAESGAYPSQEALPRPSIQFAAKPNAFGLCATQGGMIEWVADAFLEGAARARRLPKDGGPIKSAAPSQRVFKGGAPHGLTVLARPESRYRQAQGSSLWGCAGARIARSVPGY